MFDFQTQFYVIKYIQTTYEYSFKTPFLFKCTWKHLVNCYLIHNLIDTLYTSVLYFSSRQENLLIKDNTEKGKIVNA